METARKSKEATIRLGCRNYDGTSAILRGLLQPAGFHLDVFEENEVPKLFGRMFHGEFDVAEMSLAELIYYNSRGIAEFVGIPVFPFRMFRHGFIVCNNASGLRTPADLDGKRIGFIRWVQTAAIWMRGILTEEYGLSPRNTQWYVASMHHWEDARTTDKIQPKDGSSILWVQRRSDTPAKNAWAALKQGEVDALGLTEAQISWIRNEAGVGRLFENYREIEAAYYKRTGIFPIMHVIVASKAIVQKHPDLPAKIFELFTRSKRSGRDWLDAIPSMGLAWKHRYLEEERAMFPEDPWGFGLAKNRHVLEKFLFYCERQGITERKLEAKELFHPSTWDLDEEDCR
jgi:4,5-dihydroxyphthalate decarboxylase